MQQISQFTLRHTADAGVGQLKHPLQDHHSKAVNATKVDICQTFICKNSLILPFIISVYSCEQNVSVPYACPLSISCLRILTAKLACLHVSGALEGGKYQVCLEQEDGPTLWDHLSRRGREAVAAGDLRNPEWMWLHFFRPRNLRTLMTCNVRPGDP